MDGWENKENGLLGKLSSQTTALSENYHSAAPLSTGDIFQDPSPLAVDA